VVSHANIYISPRQGDQKHGVETAQRLTYVLHAVLVTSLQIKLIKIIQHHYFTATHKDSFITWHKHHTSSQARVHVMSDNVAANIYTAS